MASLIQSNVLTTRDTHNAYDTPAHIRGMDPTKAPGIRGSAWSNIPNIWQTTPQEHSNHISGSIAPGPATRNDSLTALKSPQDPPISGAAGGATSNRAYPHQNATSFTVPAPSSVGRSSRITESPNRQRASGFLSAHASLKMPHLGTATLLNGSAPDVDLRQQSPFSSMRTGENRFQTINIGGIDEFVPASHQYLHRSRQSQSKFGNEWIPAQLGVTSSASNHNIVPSQQSNSGLFEQHNNDDHSGRIYNSGTAIRSEESWSHPYNRSSGTGMLSLNNSAHQPLSATLANLQLGDTQQHRVQQDLAYNEGFGRHQQQHSQQESLLDNNFTPDGSTHLANLKDFEYSTAQVPYQNTSPNSSASQGNKGMAGTAAMANYTPSYTPPTAPGSRRSNSGSGTSTRASSQSVDTRFASFDASSTLFGGRQGGFGMTHTSGATDFHSHPPNSFGPVLIAPQNRLIRSFDGRNQHPSSSEARIQQEKEQNLSPLIKDFRANYKTKRYELKDAYNHIVEFSGDQHGSRFIQAKLETANSEEKEKVFSEIQENALQLMTDIFGNYVIQKMFEHGTQAQKKILANQMKGRVYYLTTQVYGCRVVQKALEHVLTDQQAGMVRELEGNVLSIVENQNGNHVIQKAIERVPSEHIQFIFDAHVGHVVRLSKHNYGCRVVQRILEYGPISVKRAVLAELRDAIPTLIEDQFGNYVMQHIIRNGEDPDRRAVVTLILQQLLHFSKHKFASNVVEAAIECAEDQQRQEILQRLTSGTDSQGQSQVYGLIRDQYGNYVIQKVLTILQGAALNNLVVEIEHHLVSLRRISHGKQVSAMEKALTDAVHNLGSQYTGRKSAVYSGSAEMQSQAATFSGGLHSYPEHLHSARMIHPHTRLHAHV